MWKTDLAKNRAKTQITFDPHVFDRVDYHNLDLNRIEETIRSGKIFDEKCEQPNKLCFAKYFGKENITYIVIVRCHKHFTEVRTAWSKKGK